MSSISASSAKGRAHPAIVRITHWVGAATMFVMILSGWAIYNASPILPFIFPPGLTLGGWLGAGIAWHIAAMWVLMADGLVYLAWGLASGHFRRDFLPLGAGAIWRDFRAALTLRLVHRLGSYNAVQRLLYVLVLAAAVLAVLTGLSIWKPVQLGALTWVFGGYDVARRIHFALMSCIVAFTVVHVALVALVPRTFVSMLTGGRNGHAAMIRRGEHLTQLRRLERRHVLRGGLSLGALALLTGCDLSTHDGVFDRMLWSMLRFNDRMQALLFSPDRLAATFRPDQITAPFKFNAYYPVSQIRPVPADWQLEVSGLVEDDSPWSLTRLRALPQEGQITRHICVEGWSQIGQWSGIPLRIFLQHVGADVRARYVGFECFDDYSSSIDMASALHPQTILALDFEQAALTPPWGAPVRLRIPTKLGFKNPKNIATITVTNQNPGGYWEDQGYNWFSGS